MITRSLKYVLALAWGLSSMTASAQQLTPEEAAVIQQYRAQQQAGANHQAAYGGQQGAQVVINGITLTPQQVAQLGSVPPGRYWYDAQTGAWGMEGGATQGFIQPGLPSGALSPSASNGRTGVFVNGRQLPQSDLMALQSAVGPIYPGRYWCNANADCGIEGNMQPLVNLRSNGSGDGVWSVGDGMVSSVEGNVGACFDNGTGETICWDEGLGSSSY